MRDVNGAADETISCWSRAYRRVSHVSLMFVIWVSRVSLTLMIWVNGCRVGWVASQTWLKCVTHVGESCHGHEMCRTHERVVSQTWMRRFADVRESCRTHERVVSHTWVRRVAHMIALCWTTKESCRTREWVVSRVADVSESCHIYESHDRTHWNKKSSRIRFIQLCSRLLTWLIRNCDMTHSYVRCRVIACVIWRIRTCVMTHSYVCDCLIHTCGIWLIHMCDVRHLCVIWLIRTCAMTDLYMCDIPHPYVCDMTHSYVWDMIRSCVPHDSFIHVWYDSFARAPWLIHMCVI